MNDADGPDPRSPVSLLAAYAPGLLQQVADAGSVDDLAAVVKGHSGLVRILTAVGLPVMAVSRAVALLNDRVMDRLFRLTLSPAQAETACLIVMGSEGRAEQLLKTDQDNGLILPDGARWPDLPDRLAAFSAGLARLGWPPCPGRVMVTNPAWVMTESQWQDAVRHWVRQPGDTGFMNVAIFADAAAVAGDAALLARTRGVLLELLAGHAPFLWQFARVALQFDTPLGWFGHLVTEGGEHKGQLDVKKGGIFPIVHGIRSLALEARLERATNTLDRINLLVQAGKLDRGFAVDLREAFEFLVGLRLKARLQDPDPDKSDNLVTPALLAPDERDELRNALRIVKQFKDLLTYHFHLAMF